MSLMHRLYDRLKPLLVRLEQFEYISLSESEKAQRAIADNRNTTVAILAKPDEIAQLEPYGITAKTVPNIAAEIQKGNVSRTIRVGDRWFVLCLAPTPDEQVQLLLDQVGAHSLFK